MISYCLEVSGDFACFTRPEMKVERVSYDVMTPSAARAVFEAILWKPAIRWHIRRIEVLKPIRWMSLRRNEVAGVISHANVKSAMKTGSGNLAQFIEDERQQRAGLFLRDVAYRIHADLEVKPNAGAENPPIKYREMFERRAGKGQCVNQPYLGCREFAARFRWVENPESEPADRSALDDRSQAELGFGRPRELGYMLYDLDFTKPNDPQPLFFRAQLKDGSVEIPDRESEEVRG
ncbi:type I-C CRISPR-associated protein Cas5c [Methylocaldum sp.]|uniref:type I-C CRISPR-associated protein Cas5c n=1 Tax=Methylocaldum sp. TaxID=1969727 RepID=UPI002D4E0781|nr:type I-C CRISPR-associated protein Cas5c [Methylocaldum sp.]HYE36741.1 type I-C CRISPR-associated protein Cas5c [Methylocaldum sp.]